MEFFAQEVEAAIRPYGEDESGSKFERGAKRIRERIKAVANLCAKRLPGDLIEIGCYRGETTAILAEVAEKNHKRVIAVDPWEEGEQNCEGGEYLDFLDAIAPYSNVDIIRKESQSPEAVEEIKRRELCFAFIDGLHNCKAVTKDLDTVSHCRGVIVVDDTRWHRGVEEAFKGFRAQRKINYEHLRESYIITA